MVRNKNVEKESQMKKYGIHIIICIIMAAAAFGINQKIETERSHQYIVSEPSSTLLKEIIEAKVEGSTLMIFGWGFNTAYDNEGSQCELILEDIETGEALWLRMKRNPEPTKIAEIYTNGKDYSDAGFVGSIKAERLMEDSAYEILLRYTSPYIDEAGNEQQYVKTVTTDKFFYQGELIGYNPKTFVKPEILGTELEEELEGARLFHHFPEGAWIYYNAEKLYYIMENSLIEGRENLRWYLHWMVGDSQNLPEDRRQYGFGNSDFDINSRSVEYAGVEKYRVAVVGLPLEYIIYIDTEFDNKDDLLLRKKKQLSY